jgi:phosphoribosylanthranilate isomerase
VFVSFSGYPCVLGHNVVKDFIGAIFRRIQQIVKDGTRPVVSAWRWEKITALFRVKICGITDLGDALACSQAGADALGFNFCATSPRCLTFERASEICRSLPPEVARVGVFVNESAERIGYLAEQLRLDWVQLHGDEPPDFLAQLAAKMGQAPDIHDPAPVPFSQHHFRVLRAFRLREPGFQGVSGYLEDCQRLGTLPAAVLVDAYHAGAYGGTGKTVNWISVSAFARRLSLTHDGEDLERALSGVRDIAGGFAGRDLAAPILDQPLPLVLAGGLRPDNVAEAIRIVRPAAVDTASGVETAPGRKDARLVREFVEQARSAFDQFGGAPAPSPFALPPGSC